MKKTLLLSALVASIASVAATTGSVEVYNENETIYEKATNKLLNPFADGFKKTKSTFGVKTEVKVNESGLSFGADLKAKDLTIFGEHKYVIEKDNLGGVDNKTVYDSIIDHSSVWAKYELPELSGVMTYVKGTYKTVGEIAVEADASYKVAEDIKVGLNSETTFNVKAVTSGTTVKSTHKVYAKGNYSAVKDIDAELGFTHDYNEAKTAVKNVFLNAKASYDAIKDLTLTGEIRFKHSLNGEKHYYKSIINPEDDGDVIYNNSYHLNFNYKGLKNTEIEFSPFIENVLLLPNSKDLGYGFNLNAKYIGIKNLQLSSKNMFAITKRTGNPSVGYITLNANAEYAYKATDKLTIKPSLDLTAKFLDVRDGAFDANLDIAPKISAEYKPVNNLKLSGDISSIVNFSGTQDEFNYSKTTVKANFNVKYTW